MMPIYHAIGLHMHRPPDSLKLLFDTQNWEAIQIITISPVRQLESTSR